MPYADFKLSAECLDKKRCWSQVREANQILKVLRLSREGTHNTEKKKIGWVHHPATLMWKGYEPALQVYYNTFWDVSVEKWKIKVNKLQRINFEKKEFLYEVPKWLGFPLLHSIHRGRLLNKDAEFYSQYRWSEQPITDEEGYFWPVDKEGNLHYTVEEWYQRRTTWKS